jgi:hypothetical protein
MTEKTYDTKAVAKAILLHEKEQEKLYLRKKRDFLQKYKMKALPKNQPITALQ